jgi:alpha-ketoglutarate-dependent taurine dioxygenase
MRATIERPLQSGPCSPLIIEALGPQQSLDELCNVCRSRVDAMLLEHGALLFRGFRMEGLADFDRFVGAATQRRLDYVYASTPRTALGNRIFTATEYPPAEEIPLHNENSYQRQWPLRIALTCLVPAQQGGETPIADMQRVTATLGEALMDKFERRGVRYVRHYHPFVDLSWQKAFRTEDRAEVARLCEAHAIDYEWLSEDTLRTVQVCQGTARHPATGERTLFNQAHLFHVTSVGAEDARDLITLFGADRLPRQTYYGDGAEIPAADLEAVRSAYRSNAISFPWQAGDVLLVDNMQYAHGRRPFRGPRKVLVSLMDPHSET